MGQNHCHDGSCETGHHHHHSHSCCGEHHGECGCCCHGHEHKGGKGHFADQLLELADEAWMELVKDKIKAKIQETSGKQIDELAAIVSNANHERWSSKLQGKKSCEEYHENVANFFRNKH